MSNYREVSSADREIRLREENEQLDAAVEKLRLENESLKKNLSATRRSVPKQHSAPNWLPDRSFNSYQMMSDRMGSFGRMFFHPVGLLMAAAAVAMIIVQIVSNLIGLDHGIITNRHWEPAHDETYLSVDANGMPLSTTTHYDARWWVVISDDGKSEEVDMTSDAWANTRIGQELCVKNCSNR